MKIKTKKQLNLPQLIEWAWDNGIENKEYVCNEHKAKSIIFNLMGWAEFSDEFSYNPKDTFTVELEEEITEDTEVPTLVMFYENHNFRKVCRFENNVSISDFQFHEHEVVLAYYILNDDLTMTLIWRDGKLVK